MNKLIMFAVLGLLLVGCVSGYYFFLEKTGSEPEHDIVYNPATGESWNSVEDYIYRNKIKEVADMEKQIYQGPVPQGYDLKHFRKTGETIKEVNN